MRAVRFVLAEDPEGRGLRFAPLESEAFRSAVPEGARVLLPDSLVVFTADGRVLIRSSGVLHILDRLGGVVAGPVGRGPARSAGTPRRGLRSRGASALWHRRRRKDEACPFIPAALRGRFDCLTLEGSAGF